MNYTYQHRDQTYSVRLDPQPDGSYTATVHDRTFTVRVTRGADGGLLLDSGDQRVLAYTAADGNNRHVFLDGRTLTLAVPDERATRRRAAGAGGDLTAQMPGQVVDVLVQPGDDVERGQTLVILEAMKMEIRVQSPADGIIRRVLVSKGDVVERGQLLVEITLPET